MLYERPDDGDYEGRQKVGDAYLLLAPEDVPADAGDKHAPDEAGGLCGLT